MGPQSPFHLYLKTLPQDFSHFPLNYPEELLKELKGTCFLEQIEHKKLDMKKDYLNIVAVEESFERFGLQKFCEARLLVSSRVFGIVMEGQKTDALVPMADMLNHRVPKQTSWFFCDRNNGFVIQSLRDIPSGHEVFDSYGQKCNSRFLLHYGFVLPNNPHNEAVTMTLYSLSTSTSPISSKVHRAQSKSESVVSSNPKVSNK
jgi:histone-lysine N-methyltransferase SETD3